MRSQATKEAGLQSVGETVVQGLHPMRQMGTWSTRRNGHHENGYASTQLSRRLGFFPEGEPLKT